MAKIRILAAIAAADAVALVAPAVVFSDEPSSSPAVEDDADDDRGSETAPPLLLASVDRFGPSALDTRPVDANRRTGPKGGAAPNLPIGAVRGTAARFAWFYKPPVDTSAAELARRFDVIVLTRNDQPLRDQLKAADPSLLVLQYVLANEIQNAGPNQPWRNQAAWTTGDAAALLARHPEWFARDDAGRPLAKSIGGGRAIYTMDPAQRGWTDYLTDRVLAHNVAAGWDGAFLDNVETCLSKRRREGQIPAAHPTDQAWQDAMVGHVAALRYAFASYLLVAAPTVSFRYAEAATAYAEVWWSDDFDRQPFAPTGPRHRSGDTWARDSEGGRVIVDPARGTAAIA